MTAPQNRALFDAPVRMEENLAAIRQMSNYCRWIFNLVRPHLQGNVLEAGCGNGNLSRWIIATPGISHFVGVDHDPSLCDELRAEIGDRVTPRTDIIAIDLQSPDVQRLAGQPFDTIVCLNVLEHIPDDTQLLETFGKLLKPGGRVVLLVPAFQWLYGTIDTAVHHIRRYSKKELQEKFRAAGLSVTKCRYFNLLGIAAWFWHGKALKLKVHREGDMKAWDRFVPLLEKMEATFPIPAGLSLFAVAEKPR